MPSNILVVSQFGNVQFGGAERYAHETTNRLRKRGLTVNWINTDMPTGNKPLAQPWRLFSGGYHPSWALELDDMLSYYRPDVLYAHMTVPGLVDVAVRRASRLNIPVCLVYHSDVTGNNWGKYLLGGLYHYLVGRKTLRWSAAVIISSPDFLRASRYLTKRMALPIFYAPPGVDREITAGQRKSEYPYLLFVGKADLKEKGFDLLYLAWQKLRDESPELQLLVVGSVPARPYPGVRFIGRIENRAELGSVYASALATVMPSRGKESFGMVLAEALSVGCPVIGTRLGGIPSIVTHGENGYLVTPNNLSALTDAIRKMLIEHHRLRKNIKECHHSYSGRFDWDKTTGQILDALIVTHAARNKHHRVSPH
jgi:glycosyltransferase involved in cell wall biosynthesis